MAIDWKAFSENLRERSLAGMGQLPQYKQAMALEAEQRRQAEAERRKSALMANRGALFALSQGRPEEALSALNSVRDFAPDEVDRVSALIQAGDPSAVKELSYLDQKAVAMGELAPVPGSEKPFMRVVNGQLVTVQDGKPMAQPIEGYQAPESEGARAQFAGSDSYVDEAGNYFIATRVGDPVTGQPRVVLSPVGHSNAPQGATRPVNSMGLTADQLPGQKATETTAVENRKIAAQIGKDSFERLAGTGKSIANIEQAISALDRGANTGPIYDLLPTVTEASVMLQNVQNQMGLDVIGATTFGALSKDERVFALDTALPTGLKGAPLRDWLVRKKSAQIKMASELSKAARHFSRGGTIDEYLDQMEKEGRIEYENDPQREAANSDIPTVSGAPQTPQIRILSVEG